MIVHIHDALHPIIEIRKIVCCMHKFTQMLCIKQIKHYKKPLPCEIFVLSHGQGFILILNVKCVYRLIGSVFNQFMGTYPDASTSFCPSLESIHSMKGSMFVLSLPAVIA